jgi:predicted nucleic acid-binding protein
MPITEAVFVDTSALYALLDRNDAQHTKARKILKRLLEREALLLTHSYVLVETFALVQRRLGLEAVRALDRDLVPVLEVIWIDKGLHQEAVEALLSLERPSVSLVDQVSFALMRQRGLRSAFAFDDDFRQEGFKLLAS